MVNISAKESNTSKTHSNENGVLLFPEYDLYVEKINNNEEYKKGGLVFPSYELYNVLKKINKGLSLFYTKTGEEYDYNPIFDSKYRDDNDHFNFICKNIKYNISVFKDIRENDSRVKEFLHNNRLSIKFSSLFNSIYNAFMEAMDIRNNFENEIKKKQNEQINKIVKDLSYIGIDPFSPRMI